VKYTYIALCKYLGTCKCIYYIPFMTLPSCKSIIISCACKPKLNYLFIYLFIICNGPLWFILYKKNHDILILSKHFSIFLTIWDYGGVILRNILNAHFAPLHCLSTTKFFTIITFMKNIQLDTICFYKSLSTYCTFKKKLIN